MPLLPLSANAMPVVFRSVAVAAMIGSFVATIAVWGLLGQAETTLEDSLALTGDTLEALDASAGVAVDAVAALGTSLAALEQTAQSLDTAFIDGETLLEGLATVVREDVATSLAAVNDALPGLARVGGTIDSTLSALSALPFGPAYDPSQSLGDALAELSTSLDGLPERLTEQATVIDQTAANVTDIGRGVSQLLQDLGRFESQLAQTAEILQTYDQTISEGQTLVATANDSLGGRIAVVRAALIAALLTFIALQVVPLHLAAAASAARRTA